jgi:hypothetical protein
MEAKRLRNCSKAAKCYWVSHLHFAKPGFCFSTASWWLSVFFSVSGMGMQNPCEFSAVLGTQQAFTSVNIID